MSIFSSYLQTIASINRLDIANSNTGYDEWIFHHAMLFLSPDTWWKNKPNPKKRKTIHEGIDLLFYRDSHQEIQQLNINTFIPSATGGTIINVCDDFIGKSIIVKNPVYLNQDQNLIFVYAHISPDSLIKTGMEIKQGDTIATISEPDKKKTTLPPHLHLSVFEVSKETTPGQLNWDFFTDPQSNINFINPMFV